MPELESSVDLEGWLGATHPISVSTDTEAANDMFSLIMSTPAAPASHVLVLFGSHQPKLLHNKDSKFSAKWLFSLYGANF